MKNSGEFLLNIRDIISSDNFLISISGESFSNHTDSTSLHPGAELNLYVKCIPDSLGILKGNIQVFASNYEIKSFVNIELVGYGIPDKGKLINEENVSGIWQKGESPFYICNDVVIEEGKSLKIDPGSEVHFLGLFKFLIGNNAQLIAKGTEEDSILFINVVTKCIA